MVNSKINYFVISVRTNESHLGRFSFNKKEFIMDIVQRGERSQTPIPDILVLMMVVFREGKKSRDFRAKGWGRWT